LVYFFYRPSWRDINHCCTKWPSGLSLFFFFFLTPHVIWFCEIVYQFSNAKWKALKSKLFVFFHSGFGLCQWCVWGEQSVPSVCLEPEHAPKGVHQSSDLPSSPHPVSGLLQGRPFSH
jgi:hypothetical protein